MPSRPGQSSGFSGLAPEIQTQLYGRLGGMGLVYAGTWFANYVFFRIVHGVLGGPARELFWSTTTAICVVFGLAIYALCRGRRIPARAFSVFAIGFQILGAIGIQASAFGWTGTGEDFVARVAQTLGLGGRDLLSGIVVPLDAAGLRLLYAEGVNWVGVWLLIFPLIVPMPMRRTVFASLATAATVPATLGLSAWINGVPAAVRPWVWDYALDVSIPTFICAGMAIFGASVVYNLTRELSDARHMGSYELVEKVGVGGMGEVWRARHRLLARPAAIKLIRPEVLGSAGPGASSVIQRFEREVQWTTRLTHPNTITIFDYGQAPDGTFYYVMELLDGIDLESFIERFGPVPAARAIHWLRQACGSLAEAHAHGFIHRDVKPANLFTCRHGLDTDFVKLLDFGLVKNERALAAGETRVTMDQTMTGTPAYVAPEIALGKEAGARSDIYSLGCVAYWLLTGCNVFDGETPMQVLVQHAKDAPLPPSHRTELSIPDDLESVVMDCLEKEPEARPASARELMVRLESCADAGRWSPESSASWWEQHLPRPGSDFFEGATSTR